MFSFCNFQTFFKKFWERLNSKFRKSKGFWILLVQSLILFIYHIVFANKLISIDDFEYKFYIIFYALTIVCFFALGQILFKKYRVVFVCVFIPVYFVFTLATLKHMEFFGNIIRLGGYKNLDTFLTIGWDLIYIFFSSPFYTLSIVFALGLMGLSYWVKDFNSIWKKRILLYCTAIMIVNGIGTFRFVSQINVEKALAAVEPVGPYLTMVEIDDLYLNPAKYLVTHGFITTYIALFQAGKSIERVDSIDISENGHKPVGKLGDILNQKNFFEDKNAGNQIKEPSFRSQRTNPPKIPHFIFIQFESLNKWVLDYSFNGKPIAPFLSYLKTKSMYFENFYAVHSSGGSTDAPRVSLFGLLPHPSRRQNVKKEFNSVVDIFKARGYQEASFNACEGTALDFDKLHEHLGIEKRYNGAKYFKGDGAGTMATYDLPFFEQSFEYIKKMDPKKPLFMYLITMQSHSPFRTYADETLKYFLGDEYNKKRLYLGKDIDQRSNYKWAKSSLNINYLASIYEADQAVELFFRKLYQSGLLENTFVFIYADHINNSFLMEKCLGECIPFLIYHKDLPRPVDFKVTSSLKEGVRLPLELDFLLELPQDKKISSWLDRLNMRVGRYSKVSSHLDIPPTLTYIMGLQEESFWLGSSVVSEKTKLWEGHYENLNPIFKLGQNLSSGIIAKDYKIKTNDFKREDVFKQFVYRDKSKKLNKTSGGRGVSSSADSHVYVTPIYHEPGVALGYRGRLIVNSETNPFVKLEKKVPLLGYYKHSIRYFEPFDSEEIKK